MRYAIKTRPKGDAKLRFLGDNGKVSHLRIHAVTYPDKDTADRVAARLAEDNDRHDFKVVEFSK